jgi:hypothetical protein
MRSLYQPSSQGIYVPGGGGPGSGVSSIIAGAGISVDQATGNVTVTNTNPSTVNNQSGKTALVVGQQSYAINFASPFGSGDIPVVTGSVLMPNSSGEVFEVSVDYSTLTVNGCTLWLSGVPTAASSGGYLSWIAIFYPTP